MPLASLSIDLTLGLSQLQADSGKAAQIISRDSDTMSAAAQRFTKALEAQADRAGKTAAELQVIKGATLGADDATLALIDRIRGSGSAYSAAGSAGAAAFGSITAAAAGAAGQTDTLLSTLVARIREVNAQAAQLRSQAIEQNKSGALPDDGLKTRLADIQTVRSAQLQQLNAIYDQDKAAQKLAADEAANAQTRALAAQKITDQQNGLTTSYRTQLAALRELRDAGSLTPDQFKQAGADLVAKQPVVQQRLQEVAAIKAVQDADQAAIAARASAAQKLIDQQNGLTTTYRSQIAALKELRDAGNLSTEQYKIAAASLAKEQPGGLLSVKKAGLDEDTQSLKNLGSAATFSTQQIQGLVHAGRSFFDQVVAGQSPLKAAALESGRLVGTFGSGSKAFAAVTSLLTPMILGITGATAAVGALGYAFLEGSKQSKAFADSLVLTGNYAGVTEGQYNSIAKSIAASGQVSISAAREFTQALISTGQVGPENLQKASEAAARYGEATGKSATDVATLFAEMNGDVTAGATKLNLTLNFLSTTQLQHIRTLQDTGHEVEAAGVVYDALNDRLKNLEPNLGYLDRALRLASEGWHGFWDAAFDVGRTQTIEGKIAAARQQLAAAQASGPDVDQFSGAYIPVNRDAIDTAQENLRLLQRSKNTQEQTAADTAATAVLNKKATAASDYYREQEKGAKASAGLIRELNNEIKNYDYLVAAHAKNPSVVVPSAEERGAIQAKIAKDYTERPTGRSNNHAATEADAERKAQLAKDLQVYQAQLATERDVLRFHQDEIAAIYNAGDTSLTHYYDERKRITAEGVADELATLSQSQARIQQELTKGKFKDPHERTQLQEELNKSLAQSAEVARKGDEAATLATYERAAAIKAMAQQVSDFRASTLSAEGDDAGAAALRLQQQIVEASKLSRQSGGMISDEDVARLAKATQLANDFAEANKRAAQAVTNASQAEEAYAILAARTGASLFAQESTIYGIRAKLVEQLQEAAQRTRELADSELAAAAASGRVANPKILSDASAAAIQLAHALDTMDPALNRLRDSVKGVADSITDDIGNAITGQTKSFHDFLIKIESDLVSAGTKLLVTDPLKVTLEASFKDATEGGSDFAKFMQGLVGVGGAGGPQSAQTAAVTASTSALTSLTAAASSAAVALGGSQGSGAVSVATGGSGGGLAGFVSSLFGGSSGSLSVDRAAPISSSAAAAGYSAAADSQAAYAALGQGAASSAASSSAGSWLSQLGSYFSGLFADGGDVRPGSWGIVGEAGPELVYGGGTGKSVTPLKPIARMLNAGGISSSGGQQINHHYYTNNLTVQAPPNGTKQSASQWGAEAARQLAMANSRNS